MVHILLSSPQIERCFRHTSTNNQNTQFMSSNFFFLENYSFYDIMWKNIVQPDRTQIIVLRMRILCWIPTAANTHLDYVIFIAMHDNNGCTNAPHGYVICTLPVLFYLTILTINLYCRVQNPKFPVIKYFCPVSPSLQIISQYFL